MPRVVTTTERPVTTTAIEAQALDQLLRPVTKLLRQRLPRGAPMPTALRLEQLVLPQYVGVNRDTELTWIVMVTASVVSSSRRSPSGA